MKKTILLTMFLFALTAAATAQIAQGGDYKIAQSVVASGGGASGDQPTNAYRVEGTIGQAAAGTNASGGTFTVKNGFWAAQLAPTAAPVALGGRVITASGKGIRRVSVTVTNADGSTQTVLTGANGRFSFGDLEAGQTYVFTVGEHPRYQFNQPVFAFTALANYDEITFVGLPLFDTNQSSPAADDEDEPQR